MKKSTLFTALLCALSLCSTNSQAQDNEPSNNAGSSSLDIGTLNSTNTSLTFTNCQLVPHSDKDFKRIKIERGGVLIASVPASVADYNFKIFIYDSLAPNKYINADAGFKNSPFSTETVLGPGTYYVMVQQNTGIHYEYKTDTNRYSLVLELDTTDAYDELNQVVGEAKIVPYDTTLVSKIRGINRNYSTTYNDRDNYKIVTTKKGILTAYIPVNNSNLFYVTTLLDFNGNKASSNASAYSTMAGGSSILEHEIYAGQWYLEIKENGDDKTSDKPYELQLSLDTNNTRTDATQLLICDTIIADSRGSSDTDYYSISNIPANAKVQLYNINPTLAINIAAFDNSNNLLGSVVSSTQGQTSLTYNNIPANTAYLRIHEVNNSAVISEYNIALTDPSCTTPNSIEAITSPFSFEILPNPNNGSFVLRSNIKQNPKALVIITNSLGETVKELQIDNNNETNVTLEQPRGMYFVTIISKEHTQTKKIIISK